MYNLKEELESLVTMADVKCFKIKMHFESRWDLDDENSRMCKTTMDIHCAIDFSKNQYNTMMERANIPVFFVKGVIWMNDGSWYENNREGWVLHRMPKIPAYFHTVNHTFMGKMYR